MSQNEARAAPQALSITELTHSFRRANTVVARLLLQNLNETDPFLVDMNDHADEVGSQLDAALQREANESKIQIYPLQTP